MVTNREMWAYRYKDNVEIVDKNNNVFIGSVITIIDGEEYGGEDTLKLEQASGPILAFTTGEISEISELT